ncbi:MAG: helix-turn-helix transcriptional regulator [Treponemataceae bacterium]
MKIIDSVFVYKLGHGEKLTHHGRYHAHGNDEFELHIFFDGEGSFLWDKKRSPITNNSLFLCGPHDFHSILPEKVMKAISYYAFLFKLENNDSELSSILENQLGQKKNHKNIDTLNRFLLEELVRLATANTTGSQKSAAYLLKSLLYLWYCPENSLQTVEVAKKIPSTSQKKLDKILQILESNCENNIKIEDLAYKIDFSAEHFIRFFRNHMHITPHQYLLHLKTERASAQLISTNNSILHIAESLGFENQFHFSRVFKKCTGLSPAEYRKSFSQT